MRYVVITDEPSKIRSGIRNSRDWSQVEFVTAAEALEWERRQEAGGAEAIVSQGWRFGCTFEADAHSSRDRRSPKVA